MDAKATVPGRIRQNIKVDMGMPLHGPEWRSLGKSGRQKGKEVERMSKGTSITHG